MSGWFYGLVKRNDGKIRIWKITSTEINKKKFILWAHPVSIKWMLSDFWIIIKDLYGQWKYFGKLWTEKGFEEGNKQISKYFSKIVEQTIKKYNKENKK